MSKISFYDQIARNKRKSILLLISIFIIFIALGYAISFAFSPDYFFLIMVLAIIISISYILGTYYNAEKIALMSVRAKKADQKMYKQLYNAVENMSIASGMPMPKVYVMESENINAFAAGKDPKSSVICVTTGAIKKLNKQELEGLVGHEMTHIANYDIKFVTMVAIVVGAIAIFSQLFLRSLWFGGHSNRRDSNGNSDAIFFIIAIALAIIAPLIVKLVQLSISRKREYMADAGSVKLTRYPPGLIGVLEKIKKETKPMKQIPDAVAPMFFSDTVKKRLFNLFQTHPPIDSRIKALREM